MNTRDEIRPAYTSFASSERLQQVGDDLSSSSSLSRRTSLPLNSRFAARFRKAAVTPTEDNRSPTTAQFAPFAEQTELWTLPSREAFRPERGEASGHRRSTSTSISPSSSIHNIFVTDESEPLNENSLLRRHQSLNLRNSLNRSMPAGTSPHSRAAPSTDPALAGLPDGTERRRVRSTTADASLLQEHGSTPHSASDGSGSDSPNLRSPLEGIGRTPWSPTPDDDAILGGSHKRRTLSSEPFAQDGLGISSRNGTASPSLDEVNQNFTQLHIPNSPSTGLAVPSMQQAKRTTPSLAPLITSFDGGPKSSEPSPVAGPHSAGGPQASNVRYQGPFSAAAYVRPIGHSFTTTNQGKSDAFVSPIAKEDILNAKGYTAAPGIGRDTWQKQKAKIAGLTNPTIRTESPLEENDESSQYSYHPAQDVQPQASFTPFANHFDPPSTKSYASRSTMQQAPWQQSTFDAQPASLPHPGQNVARWPSPIPQPPTNFMLPQQHMPAQQHIPYSQQRPYQISTQPSFASIPNGMPTAHRPNLETSQFMSQNGYNPIQFNCQPAKARFCVIKSYTEEDVHKSIKFNIWSSTKLGNNRLDRVYKEGSADDSPVYLFFSVNGSGHFCGIAEMLTPIDETVTSDVWADSKWKGTFQLRWIFIKDVPNTALRHLRLHNTAENKPVTSSRDTQEVPFAVGTEMLQTFYGFPSKTSLLQDLNYYETKAAQKQTQPQSQPLRQAQATQSYKAPHPFPSHQSFRPVHA